MLWVGLVVSNLWDFNCNLFHWLMTFLHQLTCLPGTPSCGWEAKFYPLKGQLNSLSFIDVNPAVNTSRPNSEQKTSTWSWETKRSIFSASWHLISQYQFILISQYQFMKWLKECFFCFKLGNKPNSHWWQADSIHKKWISS